MNTWNENGVKLLRAPILFPVEALKWSVCHITSKSFFYFGGILEASVITPASNTTGCNKMWICLAATKYEYDVKLPLRITQASKRGPSHCTNVQQLFNLRFLVIFGVRYWIQDMAYKIDYIYLSMAMSGLFMVLVRVCLYKCKHARMWFQCVGSLHADSECCLTGSCGMPWHHAHRLVQWLTPCRLILSCSWSYE